MQIHSMLTNISNLFYPINRFGLKIDEKPSQNLSPRNLPVFLTHSRRKIPKTTNRNKSGTEKKPFFISFIFFWGDCSIEREKKAPNIFHREIFFFERH